MIDAARSSRTPPRVNSAWNEAGDPVDGDAQQKRFDDNLDLQLHNVSLPGELEETRKLADRWQTYRREYAGITRVEGIARQRLYVQTLLPIFRDARSNAQRIATLNMRNMVSADGRVRRRMLEVRNVLLLLVGVGALLAFVVLGAHGSSIVLQLLRRVDPLGKTNRRHGDLISPFPSEPASELGELAEAFNAQWPSRPRDYRKIDHERLLRAQGTTQLAIDSLPDAVLVTRPPRQHRDRQSRTAAAHFLRRAGKECFGVGI